MSKQVVTLLYLNGIRDFSKVEKYLGMNGGYYEIVYDGELRKLKMPGVIYPEDIETIEISTDDEKIEEIDNNTEKLEKNDFVFPNSLDNAVESAKNHEDSTIKVETYTFSNEIKDTFEDELEKNEKENEKFLEKINEKTTTKKEPKISQKKIKIVETKEIDDDLDDFIKTI